MTALDEVAWLLNLRGGDVSYNPVFVSYVLVQDASATLYVDQEKVCVAMHCALLKSGDQPAAGPRSACLPHLGGHRA